MSSHHFIGSGRLSAALATATPAALLEEIAAEVAASGLEVRGRQVVEFDDGGATLVWVLAESHLVVHSWPGAGYATIDLHVCDYRGSNATRARELVARLTRFCFAAGSERWRELTVEPPAAADR